MKKNEKEKVIRLVRIYSSFTFELEELNGKETLAKAVDVFRARIIGAEEIVGCEPTKKTKIGVYQSVGVGAPLHFFAEFKKDPKSLCWTEAQIVDLCRKKRTLLLLSGANLFLFKKKNGILAFAEVIVEKNWILDLSLTVYSLDHSKVYDSCRVFIPTKA
ncbi:MAG: hypothetical protein WC694_01755 [Candidatus Paceibacterota bacterium]|jgi:hypothetical protein